MAAPHVQVPGPETARAPALAPATAPATEELAGTRRLGLTGTLLMALGALGAGAVPAPELNPVAGARLLGLPARMPTASLAVVYLGMGLLVLAWLRLGWALRRGAAPSPGAMVRALVTWALPLALAPPIFSKDVYSYLAQSAVIAHGQDTYLLGPAQALGVDNPLTASVPTIWRTTPAPYGPAFLTLGRVVTGLAGDDVVLGVLLHRVLALAGLALAVTMLARLARRLEVDPSAALWLGGLNPLVLFHLVSGVHNEAITVGLLLAGLGLALSAVGTPWRWVAGSALIGLAAMIKLPVALALGFVAAALARRWGGRPRDAVAASAAVGGIGVGLAVAVSLGSGLGFGWTATLGIPALVRSMWSLPTDLGVLGTAAGVAAGLGVHVDTIVALTRALGLLAAATVCLVLLHRTWRGRLDPMTGLGLGLGAVVLGSPSVYSWYLLWVLPPLALSRCGRGVRVLAVAASVVMAFALPPTGADFEFRPYQQPMAAVAAAVAMAVVVALGRWGRHRGGRRRAAALAALLLVLTGCGTAAPPPPEPPATSLPRPSAPPPIPVWSGDWPTYHHDNARTGVAPGLGPLGRLARAWEARLDGAVYGQPLVIGSTVVAATENDTVYALGAGDGHVLWSAHLGTPARRGELPCGNIDPLGITGTPAYDPDTGLVFVVAETTGGRHELAGVELVSGTAVLRRPLPPPRGDEVAHQQRAALTVLDGWVYVAYGGLFGDCGSYVGSVLAAPTTGLGPLRSYVVPTSREGGIWAPGGAAVHSGRLYYAVGNGESTSDYEGSDSVLALTPELTLAGSFAPASWAQDNAGDLDLGSMSPAVVGDRVLAVGKRGTGYLLDAARPGGIGGALAQAPLCRAFGGPATDGRTVYLPCADGLRAVAVADDGVRVLWQAGVGADGSPVIGGGAVWVVDTATGVLYALDPATGAPRAQLTVGAVPHFASPSLADGRAYVGTASGVVAVSGA